MPKPRSVALHVHSWYSLLEGVDGPESLLERAAACGYTTLALTDTNNLYGAVPFTEAARRHGVRPILGACLRHRGRRCTALIEEPAGYHSLCRILSRLHLHDPPSLTGLLIDNAEGLHVLADDVELLDPLVEAFGPRLWLEIIRPGRSAAAERRLLEAGNRLGIKPVASVAAHAAGPEGHTVLRLLTAVRQGRLLDQVPAQLGIGAAHHLADAEDLYQRFKDLVEGIVNAQALADRCRSDVLPRGLIFPPAPVPEGCNALDHLRQRCERGLARRVGNDDEAARLRLDQELHVIALRDLAGYFLVVAEISDEARRRNYGIALRGSAGNSLVCYLLGITDVNPLRFGLPMERFLHAGRVDLPDIDLDFDWRIRDAMIAWVFERFGLEHTAMISSHLFLQPRAAFRESAKANGLSTEQVSTLLETLDERVETLGEPVCGGPLGRVPRSFPLEPERWPRILEDARRLLGRPHHLSVHPGGVVLTPEPVENYAPLQRAPKGVVITQFEKDAAEHVGLVKIDLLGNRALSAVTEARRLAQCLSDNVSPLPRTRGRGAGVRGPASLGKASSCCKDYVPLTPDPSPPSTGERGERAQRASDERTPWLSSAQVGGEGASPGKALLLPADEEDPQTVELLQRGNTLGINQLESPAMRHLLTQMQPHGLADVIQALALIRPGAATIGCKELFVRRRRGVEPVQFEHPSLEPVLGETCGLMLYEDDALAVVQALTNCSATEADRWRKQITKCVDDAEALTLSRAFLQACQQNGVARSTAESLWVQLAKFNAYSFCKSHAVSYGLIAWEGARRKAHQPLVFWTAALNNNQGMYPRRVYIEAIKRAGISVLLPCVNRSGREFTIENGGIRTGLAVIAGLQEEAREAMLAEREKHGPYRDLADFRCRFQPGPEALANLIRCGAFDFTGQSRPALFLEADLREQQPGAGLFGAGPALDWSPADYDVERRLRDEWELLGFVVGPPMASLFRSLLPSGLVHSTALAQHIGRHVCAAGIVATARHTPTKRGENMQFVTLEDAEGLFEVTLFPGTCPPVAYLSIGPYLVEGTVEDQYGVITITALRIERLFAQGVH